MKNSKRRQKKSKRLIASLCVLLFILLIVLGFLIFWKKQLKDSLSEIKNGSTTEIQENVVQENPTILYQSDELEIYSFFSSSAINVDAESEFVDNLASIEFKNVSGTYLKKCEIQIKTTDGETYEFLAEDIPVDMEVMAFEISSKMFENDVELADVTYNIETEDADVLMSDQIETLVNGTEVTIKNISAKDLKNLVVTCHFMMDETSYGGSKYEYPIEVLEAGNTAVINAVDCFVGQAQIVRITAN